jgi:hypothetical protein
MAAFPSAHLTDGLPNSEAFKTTVIQAWAQKIQTAVQTPLPKLSPEQAADLGRGACLRNCLGLCCFNLIDMFTGQGALRPVNAEDELHTEPPKGQGALWLINHPAQPCGIYNETCRTATLFDPSNISVVFSDHLGRLPLVGPCIGAAFRHMRFIEVHRDSAEARMESLREIETHLQVGKDVFIFPQGKRVALKHVEGQEMPPVTAFYDTAFEAAVDTNTEINLGHYHVPAGCCTDGRVVFSPSYSVQDFLAHVLAGETLLFSDAESFNETDSLEDRLTILANDFSVKLDESSWDNIARKLSIDEALADNEKIALKQLATRSMARLAQLKMAKMGEAPYSDLRAGDFLKLPTADRLVHIKTDFFISQQPSAQATEQDKKLA